MLKILNATSEESDMKINIEKDKDNFGWSQFGAGIGYGTMLSGKHCIL